MSYKDTIKSPNEITRDQLAGTSWSNPLWYRDKWRIYFNPNPHSRQAHVNYIHDDYDLDDNRAGYAASIEAAKAEIDERFYDDQD